MDSPTFSLPPNEAVYLLLGSFPLLVWSEHQSRSLLGTFLFKMLSSVAFASGPVFQSTTQPSRCYCQLIAAGLVFSLVGDFLLLPSRNDFAARQRKKGGGRPQPRSISLSFQLGVVAFAAAHLAYIGAFLTESPATSWPTFATTVVATLVMAKWLGVIYPPSHSSAQSNVLDLAIPVDLKPLVLAYAMIISGMFAAATATNPGVWPNQRTVGGVMFVASDIFVAKDAFGRSSDPGSRGWVRIAVGYGLYFWGQMVIAGTATV
ncbi:hypothetical protein FE257_007133 [Aspergillus nanangensis]|uniref:YhhN-like protein n=1 Tax=Aspergillus nanangensis TaxID=2582783 RepID=A0AAD4CN64_ASPNN|nr:hypothetical protein FE257_007133 [Aspergillus nanangensis]